MSFERVKRKNHGLDQPAIRDTIFRFLDNSGIQTSVKHDNITELSDIDDIKESEDGYIICPKHSGTRSWVIFFRTDEYTYYAVSFPKHNIRNRDNTNIFRVEADFSKSLYTGTIMEGVFYYEGEKKVIVLDELHMLRGMLMNNHTKSDRLEEINDIITRHVFSDITKYVMYVIPSYKINKVGLKALYEAICSNRCINEIIFYPENRGKIYHYTVLDSDIENTVVTYCILIVEKTRLSDVYNLYMKPDGEKIGIAEIPDISTSKMCRRVLAKKSRISMECKKNTATDRWIPIKPIE